MQGSHFTLLGLILLYVCLGCPLLTYALTYTNPILNHNFPDPCILKTSSGEYYAYATNTLYSDGRYVHIQVATSPNLVNWTLAGDALPDPPVWANETSLFWAPDVTEHSGVYYMYHAAQHNGNTGFCVGVATSTNPLGPFKPSPIPLVCGSGFVNIDPKSIDDPVTGNTYLFWGSNQAPIRYQQLDASRTKFKAGTAQVDVIYPTNAPYESLVEGAWVEQRGGKWWLYYSGNNCCGPQAHYAVMIARADNATGPYVKMGGGQSSSVILSLNSRFYAPGHNSVLTDANGEDWIFYHAIDYKNAQNGNRRVFMMDRIRTKAGGWIIAGINGTPSITPQEAPAI